MPDAKDRDAAVEGLVDQALGELIAEARAAVSRHPEVGELVAYQEGRLEGEAAEAVRGHLVICRQCAQQVSELAAFDRDHDPSLEPGPERVAAAWERYRLAAAGADGAEADATPGRSVHDAGGVVAPMSGARAVRGSLPLVGRPWTLGASAAALLLVGFLLGLWWSSLRGGGGEQLAHHPFLVDLLTQEDLALRSPELMPRVVVPAAMDPLILALNLSDQTPYAGGYRAEVAATSGALLRRFDALQRQPAGGFLLVLARESFPPGPYRVRLLGLDGDTETELGVYDFELAYAPRP